MNIFDNVTSNLNKKKIFFKACLYLCSCFWFYKQISVNDIKMMDLGKGIEIELQRELLRDHP